MSELPVGRIAFGVILFDGSVYRSLGGRGGGPRGYTLFPQVLSVATTDAAAAICFLPMLIRGLICPGSGIVCGEFTNTPFETGL